MADLFAPMTEALSGMGKFGIWLANLLPNLIVFGGGAVVIFVLGWLLLVPKAGKLRKMREKALRLEDECKFDKAMKLWRKIQEDSPLSVKEECRVNRLNRLGKPEEWKKAALDRLQKAKEKERAQAMTDFGMALLENGTWAQKCDAVELIRRTGMLPGEKNRVEAKLDAIRTALEEANLSEILIKAVMGDASQQYLVGSVLRGDEKTAAVGVQLIEKAAMDGGLAMAKLDWAKILAAKKDKYRAKEVLESLLDEGSEQDIRIFGAVAQKCLNELF